MSLIKYSTSIDSENRPSRALKIVARSEIVQTLADVCLNNEYSKSINEQKHVVKLTNGYVRTQLHHAVGTFLVQTFLACSMKTSSLKSS